MVPLFDYIGRTYYQNYFNNIFNGTSEGKASKENSFLEHNTLGTLITNPSYCEVDVDEKIKITIPYFDCFLFSDGIGIFCFKVQNTDGQKATYENVSQLLGYLRNPSSTISADNTQKTITQFIQERLETGYQIPKDWNRYLNQLKLYTVINDPSLKRITEESDETLFELSHTMPIGSIRTDLNDKPTTAYYAEVLSKNSISIYENWKAISLLDSFTRISCSYPDQFRSWEQDYFHIYIHCLYSKFQLYFFNSHLTNLLQFNKRTQDIHDRFIEFVNDHSLPYISYKFLPNLLYEKITASLEVQKELDAMERKINRLNETYQNKKSKQLNALLLVISILSLASVFNDISQWLTNMGAPSYWVYNPITILIGVGTVSTVAWVIFKTRK